MRPLLQRVWRAAEEANSVETVTAVWRSLLGEDYAEVEHLLRPMGDSPTFPCPSPSSRLCPRRVVERHGKLLAVCNDFPRICEPVVVTPPDIVLREVRMEEMAAIAARTLGIEPEVSTSRPDGEIWKLGTLSRRPGTDLPAFFYSGRHSTRFDRAVGFLLRENPGPFLFVAARALISASPEVPSLRRRKCTIVTAEDVWFAADGGERIALEFPDERPRSRVAEAPADYAVQLPEFRREGKRWRLAFEGSAATVKHSVGMGHIHALLSAPRQPIAAAKLAGVGGSEEVSWSSLPEERIDARAKAEYKRRIVAIDNQLEDARELRNDEEIARLEDERDAILAEIRSATGIGGKIRTEPRVVKRPRQAVSMAITRAIGEVEAEHAALGRHLRASLRLGTSASYEPESTIDWRL